MAGDVETIRAASQRLIHAGDRLRATGVDQRCAILARVAGMLGDPDSAPGRRARHILPERTGLSPAMVEWALDTALAPFQADALAALHRTHACREDRARVVAPRLAAVILAGNVFTAALRGVAFPWLVGAPVLAKASSSDLGLVDLWAHALGEAAADLADTFAWVSLPGDAPALDELLSGGADLVSVFGSDETAASIRRRLPIGTRFVAHGHGVSVAVVCGSSLSCVDAARDAASKIALDIAAYDQRGCLSPHTLWVERGGPIDPASFGALVHDALGALGERLPRGSLTLAASAAQMQWRGVAEGLAVHIWQGQSHAVSYEADCPMRTSPGHRNVQVLDARDVGHVAGALGPLGHHLKCIGVAGNASEARALAAALPASVYPQLAPAGTMQTPALDTFADGRAPLSGMLRFTDVNCPGEPA